MSIFSKRSKFRVPTEVRRIKQVVEPVAQPKTARAAILGSTAAPAAASHSVSRSSHGTPRASPKPASSSRTQALQSAMSSPELRRSSTTTSRKRRAAYTNSPLNDSDPESDDEDWRETLDPSKRRKRAHTEDPARQLRHPRLWAGQNEEEDELGIVHAVEVASLADKCRPVMGLEEDEVGVRLRYPGANYLERYELVWGRDKIDGARDIMEVVNLVGSIYLTDAQAKPFLDQDHGIYRRLEKSKNTKDGKGFKAALQEYNEQLLALQKKGAIAQNIDAMRGVPRELVETILRQVYDRTVAPKVELLAKYQNGTDNVYGELLHPFVSDIFDRTKLTSEMVFVDLGSGVGNVTLQAALERGCESWGCEMMENACNLAEAQQKEFAARCQLWGIAPGKVHLERGDFCKNERTLAALKRADVVLVNNQAFTSELNGTLVNMFLDLKVGCKIVSLKTFVHDNKTAANDVAASILDVEHFSYPGGYVSWTAAPGTFCISTRK